LSPVARGGCSWSALRSLAALHVNVLLVAIPSRLVAVLPALTWAALLLLIAFLAATLAVPALLLLSAVLIWILFLASTLLLLLAVLLVLHESSPMV